MGRIGSEPEKLNRTRRIVYVVCEGLTEKQYIENFGNNNHDAGMFEFEIFDKSFFDRNMSDREGLIQTIHGYIDLKTRGEYTPYQYVTAVFHSSWDHEWHQMCEETEDDGKKLAEKIWRIRKEIVHDSKKALDAQGVYVQDYDEMDRIIRRHVEQGMDRWGNLITFDPGFHQPDSKTSYGDLDKTFVVFDRDREMYSDKRTDDKYRRLFRECEALGYEILLSTPYFEFWLLLHHENIDTERYSPYLDKQHKVLKALRDKEKAYCRDWNCDDKKFKIISEERMARFYGNKGFRIALKQSKMLPTDLESLLNSVGTNVGIELEALLMHRGPPSPF